MTGHRSFRSLTDPMPEARRLANEQAVEQSLLQLVKDELHLARQRSRDEVGKTLQLGAEAMEDIERRADLYVDALRRSIEAAGGRLDVIARLQGRDIPIRHFRDLAETRK